ncbi:hypothetical protein L0F63_004562 [Massospora cicadina]|nr:hypothetical protein L0F63_004562 [Massospora cicadina]
MKVHHYVLFGSFLAATFAQSEDASSDSSDDSGKEAANTDASQFAGVYSFVYYSNANSTAGPTAQLPCKNSTEFQLTIPDDGSSDIVRDVSSESKDKDPVYKTSQGTWAIMEVGKGNGFQTLKMNLFYNDVDEMIVCWALKKSGKNIVANVNPKNLTECPTKYVPITDTCTPKRATLAGTCIRGACNGEKTPSKLNSDSDSASRLVLPSSWSLLLISLPFLLS